MVSITPPVSTPMMAQWHACKKNAQDALLFFRLGDFYEAFHDDAKLISKELGLTLTQRQGIPMCGVPFHSSDQYIDKLIAKGHKVAVAEQTEDPKTTKGLVRRELTRIVTPGTLVHSQLLADKKNNYIAALVQLGKIFGLAWLDLTTGDFRTLELESLRELADELYRLKPAEFLIPRKFQITHPHFFSDLSNAFPFLVTTRDDWRFEPQSALTQLLSHFIVSSLDGFGLKGQSAAIAAAGALLTYLKEDLSHKLEQVTSIHNEALSNYMALDRSTVRNLELVESLSDASSKHTLLDLLDHTSTSMGGRLLAEWLKKPLLSVSQIEARFDAIACFLAQKDAGMRIQHLLEQMRDLERLIAKTAARYATPRDLSSLGHSLALVPALKQELHTCKSYLLDSAANQLSDVSDLSSCICTSLKEHPPLRIGEGNLFADGVNPELDRLRSLSKDSASWMANYQVRLREETGIKTLKVGYTKAFGYFIEVSRAKGETVPEGFQRRQTLVNAERFVTEELKYFEHQALTAEERSLALEAELFEELRAKTAAKSEAIIGIAKAIARIDALLSLALAAKAYRFVRPIVDESDVLCIEQGRHPVIERSIGSHQFIPNDTYLNTSNQMLLLTGPNMAGKSTYIRQVALIAIMAQMGSYVPAASAHIGLIDKVFSRIGASDDLARGQSTFMVEMSETANILHNATSRSLVILDEIGRGTSTYDGISIAWAVAEYLLATPEKKAKTLFATHYWELTRLDQEYKTAQNVHVAVEETAGGIVFLRKIVSGGTDRSYGIHVAKLAGLPHSVLKRAKELLASLEEQGNTPKKRTEKPIQHQLELFVSPVLEELRKLNVNHLTPFDALKTLIDLQKKI